MYCDKNGDARSFLQLWGIVDTKYKLLTKHARTNEIKCSTLSLYSGRKSFTSEESHRFIADNIARKDRGNDGIGVTQEIEMD